MKNGALKNKNDVDFGALATISAPKIQFAVIA
jgi:hypothetical protein